MRHIPTALRGLCFNANGYSVEEHWAGCAVIRHLPMQSSTVHCERTYVNALGSGHRNSKRFGRGKKKNTKHGTGLLEHTFDFDKKFYYEWRSGVEREENYPGSEEKFVLVIVMDPNWVRQTGKGKERQLCTHWLLNYINGTLLTDSAARKSDINIFEEEMHGANGNMAVSLVSVLYQCFIKTVPLVLQEGLSVFLLKNWHLHYILEKGCQLKENA